MREPKVQPIAMRGGDGVKYLISDVDKNGNRRWYLRRPGDRKVRMPPPDAPNFMEHYRAVMGGNIPPRHDKKPPKPLIPRLPRANDGYIYFLRVEEAVKIGYSATPMARASHLRTGLPVPISAFVAIRGSMRDEKRLHNLLKSSRTHGEWFRATQAIVTLMARAARHGVLMTDELDEEASKRDCHKSQQTPGSLPELSQSGGDQYQ